MSHSEAEGCVRDLAAYLLTERKRSPLTVAAYEGDLKEFAQFVRRGHEERPEEFPEASLRAVKSTHVRRYIAYMFDARKYDSRTVCRKLSSIKALYRFLKVTGELPDDPAAAIPGPSVAKRKPAPLKVDEVMRLLRTSLAGRTDVARLRDSAILELFYASGMRRADTRRRAPLQRRPRRTDHSRDRQREQRTNGADQPRRCRGN